MAGVMPLYSFCCIAIARSRDEARTITKIRAFLTADGTLDGTRWSTGGTLEIWLRGLVLVKPWPRLLTGMSPLPLLAIRATVEHMGSHKVSKHTYYFFRIV